PGRPGSNTPTAAQAPEPFSCRRTSRPGSAQVVTPGRGPSASRAARAFSNVVLPRPRPPVSSRCRLPLLWKEVQIQPASGLGTGVPIGFIALEPLLSFRGQAAAPAVSAAGGAG